MASRLHIIAVAAGLCFGMAVGGPASAQKPGGTLKIYFFDSPASMSIHEEATFAALGPMMGVFNNLVMYKQDVPLSSMESIVPDLASQWSWDEEKTALNFKLRQGVKWHDGKPFTAKDVKCTWDMLQGKTADKLRLNPRKPWYLNLEEVVTNGDYEVTFKLKRPQPGLLEEGPALPRRHRVRDHKKRVDRPAGLCLRQVRYDVALFLPGPGAQ